jgi:hypothetical protein
MRLDKPTGSLGGVGHHFLGAEPSRWRMRGFNVLTIALVGGWFLTDQFVGGSLPWVLLGLAGVGAVGSVLPDLFRREPELGPVQFSADVQVRVSRVRINGVGFAGVRLLTSGTTIATRALYVPNALGRLFGWNYTFPAADFEVGSRPVGLLSRAGGLVPFGLSGGPNAWVWDQSVVLRGRCGRRWLELEIFRSPSTTPEEVRHALVRAGAHPALESRR